MTSPTPLVVMLAGPNGAGKSTSAPYLLKDALAVEEFVNADTIAQGLSRIGPRQLPWLPAGLCSNAYTFLQRRDVTSLSKRRLLDVPMNAGSVPYGRQAIARIWSSSRFHQRTLQLPAWLIVCGGGAIMFRMTSSDAGFSPVQRTCSRSTWMRLTRGPSTTTPMS